MLYCSVFFLWAVILIFLLLAKRLEGRAYIYNMTYLVSSETLKLIESTSGLYRCCFQFSFYYLICFGHSVVD